MNNESNWLLIFEDPDRGFQWFPNESEALFAYESAREQFNCYVFAPLRDYDQQREDCARIENEARAEVDECRRKWDEKTEITVKAMKRSKELEEALKDARVALTNINNDIAADYVCDGEFVDNPTCLIICCHETSSVAIDEINKVIGDDK